jgi:hypothetical protein
VHTPTMKEIETVRRYARLVLRRQTRNAVLAARDAAGWLEVVAERGQVRRPFVESRRRTF